MDGGNTFPVSNFIRQVEQTPIIRRQPCYGRAAYRPPGFQRIAAKGQQLIVHHCIPVAPAFFRIKTKVDFMVCGAIIAIYGIQVIPFIHSLSQLVFKVAPEFQSIGICTPTTGTQ